jgi:hypothetical protein
MRGCCELCCDLGHLTRSKRVRIEGAGVKGDPARCRGHPAAILRSDRLAALLRPWALGLRPACTNWMPGMAPPRSIIATLRVSSDGAAHSTRQYDAMRPIADTCVASVNPMPGPAIARTEMLDVSHRPRHWWRCPGARERQRCGCAVTEREPIGWNSSGVDLRSGLVVARAISIAARGRCRHRVTTDRAPGHDRPALARCIAAMRAFPEAHPIMRGNRL